MTTRGFQCKFAVASGQDREPISLEQLPDEILFVHIVFNKQNHLRVHINLFNGLRAVTGSTELMYFLTNSSSSTIKEIFRDIAATSLKIRDVNFADCIIAPGPRGRNRSIPMESTCNGKGNPEGLLRNGRLVCGLPKLEIPTNYAATWRPAYANQSRRRVVSPCARAVAQSRSRMAVNMDRTCGIARFSLSATGW